MLSCGYKLISGVVANRLAKYLMKIIGRSQKGFLKEKSIHSCTLNIMDTINGAWEAKEETGVLCVDFSKAFDSVEHQAIRNILEFFNFGEVMVGMVMAILNKRIARVILGEDFSPDINIDRGTPQGDRASPYLFIICVEILLIKLLLMEGKGINQCTFINNRIGNIDIEKLTAEAYADDLTVLFKMSEGAMGQILDILEDYHRCTGLRINKEKTQLMVVGGECWAVGERVKGIEVVGEVTLLGVTIDRKLERLDQNWERKVRKIQILCNHWRNFGLGISGRVMVVKMYMMSQLVYLMNILTLPERLGVELNNIVLAFVKGNGGRLIEVRRQMLTVEQGGYGLIDIRTMDICMKLNLFKRAMLGIDRNDYIGAYIKECVGDGRIDRVGVGSRLYDGCKVIRPMITVWDTFKRKYMEYCDNGNETILFENSEHRYAENRIFGIERYMELRQSICNIRLIDVLGNNGTILGIGELSAQWGVEIRWAEYFRLRAEIGNIVNKVSGNIVGVKRGMGLTEFMGKKVKGTKRYREILGGKYSRTWVLNSPDRIASMVTLLGNNIVGMNRDLLESRIGIWSIGILPADFKNFSFKLTHGRLYLNQARAHFENIHPCCTFCEKRERIRVRMNGEVLTENEWETLRNTLPYESIRHLFWECNNVRTLLASWLDELRRGGGLRGESL